MDSLPAQLDATVSLLRRRVPDGTGWWLRLATRIAAVLVLGLFLAPAVVDVFFDLTLRFWLLGGDWLVDTVYGIREAARTLVRWTAIVVAIVYGVHTADRTP